MEKVGKASSSVEAGRARLRSPRHLNKIFPLKSSLFEYIVAAWDDRVTLYDTSFDRFASSMLFIFAHFKIKLDNFSHFQFLYDCKQIEASVIKLLLNDRQNICPTKLNPSNANKKT